MLDNKLLRLHYTGAAIVFTLLLMGVYVLKGQNPIEYSEKTLIILKTISYLITFVGVPYAYGWFGTFFTSKSKEELSEIESTDAMWKKRFVIFTILSFLNTLLFVTSFDRSILFVVVISMSVYLLNKPRISKPNAHSQPEQE